LRIWDISAVNDPITYKLGTGPSGVNDINPLNNISLQPNPTAGITSFYSNNNAGTVSVLDATGREVLSETFTANARVKVDLSNQPNGIYQLKLKSEKDVFVKKIIVNRK
jgi:hypothetical protein